MASSTIIPINFISKIPNIGAYPLHYVFENIKLKQKSNSLWLEFGVFSGKTINYISRFASDKVYGFDSFKGLPEKWRPGFEAGAFDLQGKLPSVNKNVELVDGWFSNTLPKFLEEHNNETISFIHIDCDLYSSTKFVLETTLPFIERFCVIVFDELLNYDGFDGPTGELLAWYEFVQNNNIEFEWIGMNGYPIGMRGYEHENVAVRIINTPYTFKSKPLL